MAKGRIDSVKTKPRKAVKVPGAVQPKPAAAPPSPTATPPLVAPAAPYKAAAIPAPATDPKQDLFNKFFSSLQVNEPNTTELSQIASKILALQLGKNELSKNYNVLFLFDESMLIRTDADKIYNAITSFTERKPILLVLYSKGGTIEPAYLISGLCREHSDGKFIVCIPRQAKSAATLICCGADEIHMGSMSELGPIDPQLGNLPALGLKNAIEHIAELASKYPKACDMFSSYLNAAMPLMYLGHYERIVESAVQYAERLLLPHEKNLKQTPKAIATHLTYGYKDHGFVIDRAEATKIFGDKTIKVNTPEYDLGNELYTSLSLLHRFASFFEFEFYFYGSSSSPCTLYKKKVVSQTES